MDSLLPVARKAAIVGSHISAKTSSNVDHWHPADARLFVRSNPSPSKLDVIASMLHPTSVAIKMSGNELLRLAWNGSKKCDGLIDEIQKLGGFKGLFEKMGIAQVNFFSNMNS